jgi:hypothetical protein
MPIWTRTPCTLAAAVLLALVLKPHGSTVLASPRPGASTPVLPQAPGAALIEKPAPGQKDTHSHAGTWVPAPPPDLNLEAEEILRGGDIVYRRLRRTQTQQPKGPAVIHVAYVQLQAPNLILQLSPEQHQGTAPSLLARQADALLSLNASFFDEKGRPLGLTISEGRPWKGTRDTKKYWVFGCKTPVECQIESPWVSGKSFRTFPFAVSGRPVLVRSGKPRKPSDDLSCPQFCAAAHPRSAIGLGPQRKVLFLAAAEGRRYPVLGLSLSDWAELIHSLGAHEALNLDGGGSTALVVNGTLVTARPTSEATERPVANVIHVK